MTFEFPSECNGSVLCGGEPADEPAGEHQRVEPRDGEEQHEHPPRLHQHRPPPGQGAGHWTGPTTPYLPAFLLLHPYLSLK
jgi:hypothetical protein